MNNTQKHISYSLEIKQKQYTKDNTRYSYNTVYSVQCTDKSIIDTIITEYKTKAQKHNTEFFIECYEIVETVKCLNAEYLR